MVFELYHNENFQEKFCIVNIVNYELFIEEVGEDNVNPQLNGNYQSTVNKHINISKFSLLP